MEMHIGALLFLLSPCICVSTNPFLRMMTRSATLRGTKKTDDESLSEGEVVSVVHGEPSNSEWRYIYSEENEESGPGRCELRVSNALNEVIIFCWVDSKGNLHNFSPIDNGAIQDKSVSNCHVESSFEGHCFIGIRRYMKLPTSLYEVRKQDLVFLYKINQGGIAHVLKLKNHRGNVKVETSYERLTPVNELINNSDKQYLSGSLCGFTLYYEEGVFDEVPGFESVFTQDLSAVCTMLPTKALKLLQDSTPIWVNKSFTYGTKEKPIYATTLCFHPKEGHGWLVANGHSPRKCGGVEMYCAKNYLSDRNHWGPGGVLVHELSHAFHNKFCPNGFECPEVLDAYNTAMTKRMYDCVSVHGPQGQKGGAKAYACTNAMEFFAELSTAYHFSADETTEYNKWFPHNRFQLIQHDPDSFFVLNSLWNRC